MAAPARSRNCSVPAFLPVPVRTRIGGWSPLCQARFLGMLAETGSVAAAARSVGMSRESAYRLRQRPGAESFAAAWRAALGIEEVSAQKVTPEELFRRATESVYKPVMRGGRYLKTDVKHDNSALFRCLSRFGHSLASRHSAARQQFSKSP